MHASALISFHFHSFPLTFRQRKQNISYTKANFFGSCAIYYFQTRNFSVRLVHFPLLSCKIMRSCYAHSSSWIFPCFLSQQYGFEIFVVASHFNVPVFGELRHLFCSGVFPFTSFSLYSFSPVLIICSYSDPHVHEMCRKVP